MHDHWPIILSKKKSLCNQIAMHRYNIDDFILFDINSINFLLIIFYLILYYIDAKEETLNMII